MYETYTDGSFPPGLVIQRPHRIVGLGASAGGLSALSSLFDALRADTGFAFVVISHRARGPSVLSELLQKHTKMPVVEITDKPIQALANHVYVARGESVLELKDGVLVATDTGQRSRYPIDQFLISLAADQGLRAVGVILSGSGTDGTRGIEAIKGSDGLVFVQLEDEAGHGAMPHAALETKLEDFCLPVGELAKKLGQISEVPRVEIENDGSPALEQLFDALSTNSGIDFSAYKRTTLGRRIARRMAVNGIESFDHYVDLAAAEKTEVTELAHDLLIGVTRFFRDPESWEALTDAMCDMLKADPELNSLRMWVAGCSTGEEAYTLAIVLLECGERIGRPLHFQIFATDVNAHAIAQARRGSYPVAIVEDVGDDRFARYFRIEDNVAVVVPELREHIVFAAHDVLSDPPFRHLHLVTCRNLLIYLESRVQHDVLALFHHGLVTAGLLFMGGSESLGSLSTAFDPISMLHKIFRRSATSTIRASELTLKRPKGRDASRRAPWLGERTSTLSLAERVLLDSFTPASVIVDAQGIIMYVHGRTGLFLEPAHGSQTTVNVFDMARDGLQFDLSDIHRQALLDPGSQISRARVPVRTNGDWSSVDLSAQVVERTGIYEGCVLLSFAESDTPPAASEIAGGEERVVDLQEQLRHVQRSRQSFVEELETANEDLKSANEELQSTNEELRSANEELETSREEMQLLNEELRTVNDELHEKIIDLERANDDLTNLVSSSAVATIFVDLQMRVVSFTPGASELIKLIPSDVGRPLSDLTSRVGAPVAELSQQVASSLVFLDREVAHDDGRWFLLRIHPYRTSENMINGVVISFRDVTETRALALRLEHADRTLATGTAAIVAYDEAGKHRWTLGSPFGFEAADPLGAKSPLDPEHQRQLRELRDVVASTQEPRHGALTRGEPAQVYAYSFQTTDADSPVGTTLYVSRQRPELLEST